MNPNVPQCYSMMGNYCKVEVSTFLIGLVLALAVGLVCLVWRRRGEDQEETTTMERMGRWGLIFGNIVVFGSVALLVLAAII